MISDGLKGFSKANNYRFLFLKLNNNGSSALPKKKKFGIFFYQHDYKGITQMKI